MGSQVIEMPAAVDAPGSPAGPPADSPYGERADGILHRYFLERVPEFARCAELRQEGWKNPESEKWYAGRKQRIDLTEKRDRTLYGIMWKIAGELRAQGVFKIKHIKGVQPRILDLCMAPGAFLTSALHSNPKATALAASLPTEDMGYGSRLNDAMRERVEMHWLDVTRLAEDMLPDDPDTWLDCVPHRHPDETAGFLPRLLPAGDLYDLAFCDGQPLPLWTQREFTFATKTQPRRLITTQLALSLEHLRPGGTLVAMLHKADRWQTVHTVYLFRQFARVTLFKPLHAYREKSSFYLVARDVRSDSPAARDAVAWWKTMWRLATLGGEAELNAFLGEGEKEVERVLDEFGEEMGRLGRKVWAVQAEGLEWKLRNGWTKTAQAGKKNKKGERKLSQPEQEQEPEPGPEPDQPEQEEEEEE